MPAFRHTSSTVVPSSACLRMNAICCSLNLDVFIHGFPCSAFAKPNREFLSKLGPVYGEQVKCLRPSCDRASWGKHGAGQNGSESYDTVRAIHGVDFFKSRCCRRPRPKELGTLPSRTIDLVKASLHGVAVSWTLVAGGAQPGIHRARLITAHEPRFKASCCIVARCTRGGKVPHAIVPVRRERKNVIDYPRRRDPASCRKHRQSSSLARMPVQRRR